MERPIGYWLKLVDRLIDESFEATLDEHGITRLQWQLLSVIRIEPARADALNAAVAPFLAAGESTAVAVDELVESDWVAVSDGLVTITAKGEVATDRLGEVVAAIRARLSEGVPQDDYDTTTRTLRLMAENLGWVDA